MNYEFTFDEGKANNLLNYLNELIIEKKYVFRGYGKEKQLLPSIIRDDDKYKNVEGFLLYQLERYGSKYFSANSPIEFMSFGQHFGLPTRLLDFTYNPFIALYFALYDNKGTTGIDKDYYYLMLADTTENIVVNSLPLFNTYESLSFSDNTFALKYNDMISFLDEMWIDKDLKLNSYLNGLTKCVVDKSISEDKLAEKIKANQILFITPNFSNERIMAQQGLFMFPYTLNKEAHFRILETNTKIIRIHKKLRKELQDYLDVMGFNSFHLMPDLSSVCGTIKRNVIKKKENEIDVKIGQLQEQLEPYRILASNMDSIDSEDIINLKKLFDEYEKLGRVVVDSRINEAKDIINKIELEYEEHLDYMVDMMKEDYF